MRQISAGRYWRAKACHRSTSKGRSALSVAIYSTARWTLGSYSRRARCWATRIIGARSRGSICAAREAIQAVALRVHQDTTPRAKSYAISNTGVWVVGAARRDSSFDHGSRPGRCFEQKQRQ